MRFANEGWHLILAARRHERLQELRKEIGKKEPVQIITMDVRDRRAVQGVVENLPDEFNNVDVLINSAGLALGLEPAAGNGGELEAVDALRNLKVGNELVRQEIDKSVKRNSNRATTMYALNRETTINVLRKSKILHETILT